MLVHDLTEVVNGIASVTRATISKPESSSWIAHIRGIRSVSSRHRNPAQAHCVERKEDVASSQVGGSGVDLCWIRLIEHIEQARSELNLLVFTDGRSGDRSDTLNNFGKIVNKHGRRIVEFALKFTF